MRSSRTRRRGTALAALGLALAAGVAGLGPVARVRPATARRRSSRPTRRSTTPTCTRSSAPTSAGHVTLVANWIPFEEPNGGPNFYPFATDAALQHQDRQRRRRQARRHVPLDVPEHDQRGGNTFLYNNGPVTSLDDENLLFRQTYTLQAIVPRRTVPDPGRATRRSRRRDVGPASMPDYAHAAQPGHHRRCRAAGKIFAGQADDPFFLDLRVFDLLYGGDLTRDRAGHRWPATT